MAFDYRKLRGKITEVFGTQDKLAQALGMAPNTLSMKLNGKNEFSQGEIIKMSELLAIKKQDFHAYFFTQQV